MTTEKLDESASYSQIRFRDSDVVNPDDCIYAGEYNPHNTRPWLLHDHGFVLAVVFADCEQDALDIAVDADKLDRYLVSDDERSEHGATAEEQDESLSYLGNAGEPFDIESLSMVELPIPRRSTFAEEFQRQYGDK